jgi:hypothetical protein
MPITRWYLLQKPLDGQMRLILLEQCRSADRRGVFACDLALARAEHKAAA